MSTPEFEAFVSRLRDFQSRTWAGHVLPIESDALAATFEKLQLEKWYAEDNIRCESAHKASGPDACTVEVTHVVNMACENRRFRVCQVSAATEREFIRSKPTHRCGAAYADCVTVRPI